MKTAEIKKNGKLLITAALADKYFLRLRGLIGRSAAELGGLLISPCNQVHTCFMKESIDIIYLDADGRILRIDEGVPPWKMLRAERRAKRVLELPEGNARLLELSKGTELSIK